jgi:hypothetical protein
MERRRITVPRSTRKEPRDGMTRESKRKNSTQAIRNYFLTPGYDSLGMEIYI